MHPKAALSRTLSAQSEAVCLKYPRIGSRHLFKEVNFWLLYSDLKQISWLLYSDLNCSEPFSQDRSGQLMKVASPHSTTCAAYP